MSYGHNWGRPTNLPLGQFRKFAQECKQLRHALGIPKLGFIGGVKIGSADGHGRPIFTEDLICFNGRPSHDSFIIHRQFDHPERDVGLYGLHWDFVYTAQKPYDTLVVAVLLSLKYYFPLCALRSDGGEQDWAKGINLYQRVTGRDIPDFRTLGQPNTHK